MTTVTSSAANHLLFSRYLFCKLFVATIFSENEGMGTSTHADGDMGYRSLEEETKARE